MPDRKDDEGNADWQRGWNMREKVTRNSLGEWENREHRKERKEEERKEAEKGDNE